MYKAMIFAAGLGTRLRPLTDHKPKALVELCGQSLLQRTIDKLTRAGVSTIIINIHHFPALMQEAIAGMQTRGAEIIISDESEQLLDTGGGLLKASKYLEGKEPFFLHNVDIVSDINLKEMLDSHRKNKALATLAVSQRATSRYFLWHQNQLCGWQNTQTEQQTNCYPINQPPLRKAFSGIHVISPKIFELITETGSFSINSVYLRLAAEHKIMAYEHNPEYWADIGTPEKLNNVQKRINTSPGIFES